MKTIPLLGRVIVVGNHTLPSLSSNIRSLYNSGDVSKAAVTVSLPLVIKVEDVNPLPKHNHVVISVPF